MPEPTPDPIDRLDSLRNGGIAVSPLPPEEVRRLGSRRRTRRYVVVSVVAAAAVVSAVIPVALLSGDDGKASAPPIATISPEPTPATKVVVFPGSGLTIADPADVDQLAGTSPDFRAFIADQVRSLRSETDTCPDAPGGVITVQKYNTDGYAIGGVNNCGGYVALWANRDAGWREVMGGQEAFDCDALRYFDIPKSFAGGCYDYSGDFGPRTIGDLQLGATESQIETAGGSVLHTSGIECQELLMPDRPRVPDQVDGWYSPIRGLLAVYARPGTKTPQRIGLGSTIADVRAAYPKLEQVQRGPDKVWVVPIDASSEYEFSFTINETVNTLTLARPDQDCYMWH